MDGGREEQEEGDTSRPPPPSPSSRGAWPGLAADLGAHGEHTMPQITLNASVSAALGGVSAISLTRVQSNDSISKWARFTRNELGTGDGASDSSSIGDGGSRPSSQPNSRSGSISGSVYRRVYFIYRYILCEFC